jgi:hypothetical protein
MVRGLLGRDARTQVGANCECGLVGKAGPAAVAEGQGHPSPIARQLGWILQFDGPRALNRSARGYPSRERQINTATYSTRDLPCDVALSKTSHINRTRGRSAWPGRINPGGGFVKD